MMMLHECSYAVIRSISHQLKLRRNKIIQLLLPLLPVLRREEGKFLLIVSMSNLWLHHLHPHDVSEASMNRTTPTIGYQ